MKNAMSTILNLILILLLSGGCEKNNSDETDIDSRSSKIYESCCGAEPVEYNIIDEGYIYIPNVFTPNEDGVNDRFRPYFGGSVKGFGTMTIYNMEKDTILYILDGELINNVENIEDFGWNGNLNLLHDYERKYVGGFKYEILFWGFQKDGSSLHYKVEGSACAIQCGPDAVIFKSKEGCFYPEQRNEKDFLDKTKAVTEKDCFE
ncbi:MAG: hypothetical protein R2771_15695 [Saprospiraceae bacterium]